MELTVIERARRRAEAERLEFEAYERDPNWRVVAAARLLREARKLADGGLGALDATGSAGAVDAAEQLRPFIPPSGQGCRTDHLLKEAVEAIRRATRSVKDGRYGNAPTDNVRATEEYRLWSASRGRWMANQTVFCARCSRRVLRRRR